MASGHQGMIFILGSRGRLGRALCKQLGPANVTCIEREVYANWAEADATSSIIRYFSKHAPAESVICVCSGLLDPRLPPDQLHDVNFKLPQNIIRTLAPLGFRTMTFGTAMEDTLTANPYVQSKRLLSQLVQQMHGEALQPTHVRIHTLYGADEPSPFMFLGQILTAVRSNTPFNMTQGRQLREYHHVEDDAVAIASLIERKISGVVKLSHGHPIRLRTLAEAIFQALGKPHLLRVGALPEPAQENFGEIFTPPETLNGMKFRDSIGAVVEYMKTLTNA
jgi:nucleoside-diphosphate-sugar epimerase